MRTVRIAKNNYLHHCDYIAKGTFLSRKEDFHTKGRYYFEFLNSFAINVHVLSLKRFKEIGNNPCMTFTEF